MIPSVIHLMANVVHPSEAAELHDGIYAYAVHFLANAEHPREAAHDGICSTLDGKCITSQ